MLAAVALSVAGCASNAGTGALIGGAAGAGAGAIIGHNSHGRTGSGALIGGAVGALGGALVGGEIDREQAQQREAERYRDQYSYYGPEATREVVVERYDGEREVIVEREFYSDDYSPPPEYVEVVTVRPYPGAMWVRGHWIRERHRWCWVPGHWI